MDKEQRRQASREYYRANSDTIKERQKKYYLVNRDEISRRRSQRRAEKKKQQQVQASKENKYVKLEKLESNEAKYTKPELEHTCMPTQKYATAETANVCDGFNTNDTAASASLLQSTDSLPLTNQSQISENQNFRHQTESRRKRTCRLIDSPQDDRTLVLKKVLPCKFSGAYKFYKETERFCYSGSEVRLVASELPEYLVYFDHWYRCKGKGIS